jgi:hypothetical protein
VEGFLSIGAMVFSWIGWQRAVEADVGGRGSNPARARCRPTFTQISFAVHELLAIFHTPIGSACS